MKKKYLSVSDLGRRGVDALTLHPTVSSHSLSVLEVREIFLIKIEST
jgi:hypothetical protein